MVSCKAVVALEPVSTSLSFRVVSGMVVSVRRSSVVVKDVKSGLVSGNLKSYDKSDESGIKFLTFGIGFG